MSFSIERYHDISCGHRVFGHESKCAHLHGHNYRIYFFCRMINYPNALDSVGRVVDFSLIKEILCMWLEERWDHTFLIWKEDPAVQSLCELDPAGITVVSFNPTAENMARYLVEEIAPKQLAGTGIELYLCTVEETRKCSATYTKGI